MENPWCVIVEDSYTRYVFGPFDGIDAAHNAIRRWYIQWLENERQQAVAYLKSGERNGYLGELINCELDERAPGPDEKLHDIVNFCLQYPHLYYKIESISSWPMKEV